MGGLGVSLSLLGGGTFTRSTEGSYLTGAPTDGSSAFLAWAGADVRRVENRGDGLGPMLLMEGSRTNYVLQNRNFSTYWSPDAGVYTAGQPSPDGIAAGYRQQVPSTKLGDYQLTVGMPTTGYHSVSQWIRSYSGTVTGRFSAWEASGTANLGMTGSIDTTFRRWDMQYAALSQMWIAPSSGRALNSGAIPAGAADQIADLIQIEAAAFPSSAIRTTAATVTRAADALSYAAGQYPASFCDQILSFTFAPDCSSAELVAAAGQFCPIWFGTGSANGIFISNSLAVSVWLSNSQKIVSSAISWSRGQPITFTVRPSAGMLIIGGATTGNGIYSGTPFTWSPSDALWIGSRNTGADACFGRFSPTIVGV